MTDSSASAPKFQFGAASYFDDGNKEKVANPDEHFYIDPEGNV